MSEALSSALRFEDHFGPIVPEVPASSEARPTTPQPSHSAARLRDLAQAMRHNVVQATVTTDVAEKVELWGSYRTARRRSPRIGRHGVPADGVPADGVPADGLPPEPPSAPQRLTLSDGPSPVGGRAGSMRHGSSEGGGLHRNL